MIQRLAVPRFVGGTAQLISPQASRERAINLFKETTSGAGGKVQQYLRMTEGIVPRARFADRDTTGIFAQDDQCFVCVGSTFGEVQQDFTSIPRGSIAYNTLPSSMATNGTAGHQVMVVSAGHVYMYNLQSAAFTEVSFFPDNNIYVQMCEFMDGYFFALERNSRRVYYSALEDGLSWDATFGYIERSWGSDAIVFIKRSGRQLWLVGGKTGEIWADNGNATQPFAPIQGAFLDMGCISGWTAQRDGDTLSWMEASERGGGRIVRATGYTPSEISTYAIDAQVQQQVAFLETSEAFVHQLGGHTFYWLQNEQFETTPVYDFAEQTWSERARWEVSEGRYRPHVARVHAYAFEKHLIGTREDGIIYELSPTLLQDGEL